jgi:hypothetical protein
MPPTRGRMSSIDGSATHPLADEAGLRARLEKEAHVRQSREFVSDH